MGQAARRVIVESFTPDHAAKTLVDALHQHTEFFN